MYKKSFFVGIYFVSLYLADMGKMSSAIGVLLLNSSWAASAVEETPLGASMNWITNLSSFGGPGYKLYL